MELLNPHDNRDFTESKNQTRSTYRYMSKGCARTSQLLSLITVYFALAGCANLTPVGASQKEKGVPALTTYERLLGRENEIRQPFKISPGDTLNLTFNLTPELNAAIQVQPDGFINLPLIGAVQATGKTPPELKLELETKYEVELELPEISVHVDEIRQFTIFVGGAVKNPQAVAYLPKMTVLQAIISAGGTLEESNLGRVILVRQASEPVTRDFLNLRSPLNNDYLITLKPMDVIFIP